jgi:hypothetical protein
MLRALVVDYGLDDETPAPDFLKFALLRFSLLKFGLPFAVTTDRRAASSAKSRGRFCLR